MSTARAPDLAAGLQLLDAGRPELAERYLRRALADEPEDAFAHAMLATCLAQHGSLDEAEAEARTALQLAPGACFAQAAAASASRASGRLGEAERSARTALDLHPTGVEHHSFLADILLRRGRLAESLRASSAGLAIDPSSTDCLNARARALVGRGEIDQARAVVREALVAAPESAALHQNLGFVLLLSRRRELAIEELTEALRLDPGLKTAEQSLAAARRMHADDEPSMMIARQRLLTMQRRRQGVLIFAFALVGFAAPVCWVVAGLTALVCLLSATGGPYSRRGVEVAAATASRLAVPTVIVGLLVSPLMLLGPGGLVAWLGGAAVAAWLAIAAASRGTRRAEVASLGASGLIIAVSALDRLGVLPPAPTLFLLCLSIASLPAQRRLSDWLRPMPETGPVSRGDGGSGPVDVPGAASTSDCTCEACMDAVLYT